MSLKSIKAKDLKSGYIWFKGGFNVYYSFGYIVSCYDFTEKYKTLKEAKQSIQNYLKKY